MKDETLMWLKYAEENLTSAKILIKNNLYIPCLQNVQQSVEKTIKAIFIENAIRLKRTHNIMELKHILLGHDIQINLTDDECDFVDTIYLPSKYPLDGIIPEFDPDEDICHKAIHIAEKVFNTVKQNLAN